MTVHYSIRLDEIVLESTANPYPYWDQIVLAARVDRIATVDGVRGPVGPAQQRTAYLGGMGPGAVKPLQAVPPAEGGGWELDIPEAEPGDEIELSVALHNVRGLPDQEITRLIGKISVLGAEIGAGELIHTVGTLANVAKAASLGIAGFVLEHVIDALFPDPPSCTGRVMKARLSCDRTVLAGQLAVPPAQPHELEGTFTASTYVLGRQQTMRGSEPPPDEDCGHPSASFRYTIRQTTPLSFGVGPTVEHTYAELASLRIEDIVGTWVDVGSVFSPAPRVMVGLRRGVVPLKDAVDVTVREQLFGAKNSVTTVVDRVFPDVHLEWMGRLLPGKDVFGVAQPLGLVTRLKAGVKDTALATPPPSGRGASQAQAASTGELAVFSALSAAELAPARHAAHAAQAGAQATAGEHELDTATAVAAHPPEPADLAFATLDWHRLSLLTELRELSLEDHQIAWVLRLTPCLPLPHGMVLSFWAVFTAIKGQGKPAKGLAVRYARADSLVATRTDCWLARWNPVK